jgi:outer membrane protein assembly factor BamB
MPAFVGILGVGSSGEPARRWQDHRAAWGEPAIDGKRLYAIVVPNRVAAFSLTSGREQWQTSIGVRGTILTPTIVTTSAAVIVADDDITGLDGSSGAVLWHVGLKESGAGRYLGATHGSFVFAGSSTGRLYAIDSRTGRIGWSSSISGSYKRAIVYSPASDGHVVAVRFNVLGENGGGGVAAFSASDGKRLWQTNFIDDLESSAPIASAGGPVINGDLIVVAKRSGQIVGFERQTGRPCWQLPRIPRRESDFRALAITDRTLIAGSLTGMVIAYNIDSRREIWRYVAAELGSASFKIAVDQDVVFVPFLSGNLIALNAKTGKEQWRLSAGGAGSTWLPAIYARMIFVANERGTAAFLEP